MYLISVVRPEQYEAIARAKRAVSASQQLLKASEPHRDYLACGPALANAAPLPSPPSPDTELECTLMRVARPIV